MAIEDDEAVKAAAETTVEENLADIEMLRDIDPNTLLYSHFGS